MKSGFAALCFLALAATVTRAQDRRPPALPIDIAPRAIASDTSVRYDYDIVYVRGTRRADGREARWAEFSNPTNMEPGADLMLLHPDGSEEVLVSGKDGSCLDPCVSFDGKTVFFAKFIDARHTGSDIHKIDLATRKVTRLTDQRFTPNTGAADWSKLKLPYGVFNLGPCPAPGGRVVYTSNRNAHVPPRGYPRVALQLFSMDEDGSNIEQIGHLNVACALHPTILKDGRILFSSLESQGLHEGIHWAIWSIHPDGTNWNPVVSGLLRESGAVSGFHFQAQLSDGGIVVERYYNQNQKGFGTLFRIPPAVPADATPFGPGDTGDPRNQVPIAVYNGRGQRAHVMPFTPWGMEMLTPWIHWQDFAAQPSVADDPASPRVGKVTHPCGAPDNHLLVAWTLGPIGGPGGGNGRHPMGPTPIDAGIYLMRSGRPTSAPGEMLLIKNDPKYNEQWPRPVVPYERIYGVKEPARLTYRNDGTRSPHLPEGTPFALIGASSLYKRETAPNGRVSPGSVTAKVPATPGDTPGSIANYRSLVSQNWQGQGADAGRYDNADIHAIRIVIQEPLTDVSGRRTPLFASHANERLRVLGEIPVRKFDAAGRQPLDPDGNPDTSFLARIPADQPFTFQTIDKDGMVLNMAQTWHQLRPGEIRNDCGGCHAHSQKPTDFARTAAAAPDYPVFDLTETTALLTSKAKDESNRRWDDDDLSGLRRSPGILNVEYRRDIQPILQRSCVACHTRTWEKPAGGLVLDDDDMSKLTRAQFTEGDGAPQLGVPATYARLVSRRGAESRYMYRFQSRRSYLIWKLHGRRLDGWTNDTFPSLVDPHDLTSGVHWKGRPVDKYQALLDAHRDTLPKGIGNLQGFVNAHCDADYTGGQMPPPDAVKGTYKGPDGQLIKVEPLSDEDRLTFVRWIDLGCPIDLDPRYDPSNAMSKSHGWMGDDQRPTVVVTHPGPGVNGKLDRILIGMHDAYTGLDGESFTVTADFAVDGIPAGQDLSAKFKTKTRGVRELTLANPITRLARGKLKVSVKDRQGNVNEIERTFSVTPR